MSTEVEKKPSYKDINGTTRVGDFLRSIGQSQILESALKIATTGGLGIFDVVRELITKSKEIGESERVYALKMLDYDIQEQEEISKRWNSDMVSDSFLSKNVRPLILLYSWFLISLMIFFISVRIMVSTILRRELT